MTPPGRMRASRLGASQREPRRAQRRPGVVGDLPGPDQVPERLAQRLGWGLQLGDQVAEEAGAPLQAGAQQLVLDAGRAARGRWPDAPTEARWRRRPRGSTAPPCPSAPAAPRPTQTSSPPAQRASSQRLRVGARAPRQHVALPALDRQRQPLQRHQHLAQPVHAGAGGRMAVHPLPGGQERGQPSLLGRLDLLAQDRQRGAAQAAQHIHVTPVPPGGVGGDGPQLAAHDRPVALELAQHGRHVHAVAGAHLLAGEGSVRGGVAGDQLAQRVGHVGEERSPAARPGARRRGRPCTARPGRPLCSAPPRRPATSRPGARAPGPPADGRDRCRRAPVRPPRRRSGRRAGAARRAVRRDRWPWSSPSGTADPPRPAPGRRGRAAR